MKLDTMKGLRRTHYCGEVPETEQEVVVCGFADRVRDMGNLIFINLRDRTGLVQLASMMKQTEPFLKRLSL